MILRSWKEIAAFCKVHPRTVKRWHYEILKVPFQRANANLHSSISIHADAIIMWLNLLDEQRAKNPSKKNQPHNLNAAPYCHI